MNIFLPWTVILILQLSSGWHSNASRFFRTALMAVDVSLHGMAESYCMVVNDDRRLGKVVSVIYKSVFFNYSQNIFQFLMKKKLKNLKIFLNDSCILIGFLN